MMIWVNLDIGTPGLSMNILRTDDKSPVQECFFQK